MPKMKEIKAMIMDLIMSYTRAIIGYKPVSEVFATAATVMMLTATMMMLVAKTAMTKLTTKPLILINKEHMKKKIKKERKRLATKQLDEKRKKQET